MTTVFVWVGFVVMVLILLAFDLGAFSGKKSQTISARQALFRTGVYAFLAVMFTVFIYFAYTGNWFGLGILSPDIAQDQIDEHPGPDWLDLRFPIEPQAEAGKHQGWPTTGRDAATMFFTGYLVEQSLSMDNIFVIALILTFFQVPAAYQHRVLFWGILGALVMRGVMIAAGSAVIHSFSVVIYFFGALLIITAAKMFFSKDDHVDFENGRLMKFFRKRIRIHPGFVQDAFFVKVDGNWAVTSLFLALLIIEFTDLLFAVDSIPAVFGITHDPFLVFTSNVFAILGLRSLYFALADLLDKFHCLKYSLVAILAFVGFKMLIHEYIGISPLVSLTFIAVMLGAGMIASWVFPPEAQPVAPASSGAASQTTYKEEIEVA